MYLAVVRAWYQSGTKPSRARAMAGASTSRNSMVPHRARASVRPATDPGTATERGPKTLRSSRTRGQAKRAVETPSPSGNISAWAARGAHPLKSRGSVSPRRARWTSMVPGPPMVLMNGSTTVMAKAVATAASTAFPPFMSTAAPTSAPRGCSAVTSPRGARGVSLVTRRRERIMRPSPPARGSRAIILIGRLESRDVDHALLLAKVQRPAERIRPRRAGARLYLGPEAARLLLHRRGVGRLRHGRTEQGRHLRPAHAHRHLPVEAEGRHLERVGILGMLREVARDALLQRVVEVAPLLEGWRSPELGRHAPGPQRSRRGPLRRALFDRLARRAANQRRHHHRDEHSPRAHAPMIDQSSRSPAAELTAGRRPASSHQGGLQHDPPVDDARSLGEETPQLGPHLRRLAELPEQVDEPAHGADEVALVTAEGRLHDARPVILPRGPPEHGGREPGIDLDAHAEAMRPLGGGHRVGSHSQLLELLPDTRVAAQEAPGDVGVAGPRLLEERRAHRRRFRQPEVGQSATPHRLCHHELVLVAQARHETPLGLEDALTHRPELLQDFHNAQKLLPVRPLQRLERMAAPAEAIARLLHVAPRLVAPRGRPPGTAVALAGGQGRLRAPGPFPVDQVWHGQLRQRISQMAEPPPISPSIVRDVQGRRGPEDPLDDPGLDADHRAVGQERVHQGPVAADAVNAQDEGERRSALAPDESQPSGLGLQHGTLTTAGAAPERLTMLLDLVADLAIAADTREIPARRLVRERRSQGRIEAGDLGLQLGDALEVLVLAERRLDALAQHLGRRPGGEEHGDGAVAELELALDGLGRAIDHPKDVVDAVAHVEGNHALALGVDPAPARPTGHLDQLVVQQGAEAVLAALGQSLEDDAARGHVDAESHGLGGEDHLAEPALEERLDEPLQAGQDAGVVQTHAQGEPLEDALIQRGFADRRRLPERLVNGEVDLTALRAGEQGPSLREHVIQGALAAGAAEDEVDRGQPAARFQALDEHDRRDDAPRVPAAARVGTARLVAHRVG